MKEGIYIKTWQYTLLGFLAIFGAIYLLEQMGQSSSDPQGQYDHMLDSQW